MEIKQIPYSQEAEASLLGNFTLFSHSLADALEAGLLSHDFFIERNRLIFSMMVELKEAGLPYDVTSLIKRLKDYQTLDKAGGVEYLLELQNASIGANSTTYYVKILKEKSYRRKMLEMVRSLEASCYDGAKELDTILDNAEKQILAITRDRYVEDFKETPLVVEQVIDNIKALRSGGGKIGIKTGFSDLDYYTKGFKRGDLIILAARPSVGKTAFALNLALNIASSKSGNLGAVAIFSLEMGADQLITRMLSIESRIESSKMADGRLTNDEFAKLFYSANILKNEKIRIDDTAAIKVSEIFSKCRKLNNKEGLSAIIIDYIQLIGSSSKSFESRQQEVSEISRGLKALARELDVPVIALSQLSRSVEKREDKRPLLSDLRESGALEQDADIVMFLYRDEYYKKEAGETNEQEVELNIAKHRNGQTGLIKIHFKKQIGKFLTIKRMENNQ